jgi:hypothetical protein
MAIQADFIANKGRPLDHWRRYNSSPYGGTGIYQQGEQAQTRTEGKSCGHGQDLSF